MASQGYFDTFRMIPFPSYYGEHKTAVTVDLVIVGLIFAFVIFYLSMCLMCNSKTKDQVIWVTQLTFATLITLLLLLVNFGMNWESATITSSSEEGHFQYEMGLFIGLRGINITMIAKNESLNIQYNEHLAFNDPWGGRAGFGPDGFSFNRDFRRAQLRGLPLEILDVAEYFTVDGEGIRFGRYYKIAGYFTHIYLWLAFSFWLLSMVIIKMILRYGGYLQIMTGIALLTANVLHSVVTNPTGLEIPVNGKVVTLTKGWCYFVCLATGIFCLLAGGITIIIDLRFPHLIVTFFRLDPLQDYEEVYIKDQEIESGGRPVGRNMSSIKTKGFNSRMQTSRRREAEPQRDEFASEESIYYYDEAENIRASMSQQWQETEFIEKGGGVSEQPSPPNRGPMLSKDEIASKLLTTLHQSMEPRDAPVDKATAAAVETIYHESQLYEQAINEDDEEYGNSNLLQGIKSYNDMATTPPSQLEFRGGIAPKSKFSNPAFEMETGSGSVPKRPVRPQQKGAGKRKRREPPKPPKGGRRVPPPPPH